MDTRSIKTIPNAFGNGEIIIPLAGDKRVDDAGRKYTWVVKTEGTISIGIWEEEVVKYEIDWSNDIGVYFTATVTATPPVNTVYPPTTGGTIGGAPNGPAGTTVDSIPSNPTGSAKPQFVFKKGRNPIL